MTGLGRDAHGAQTDPWVGRVLEGKYRLLHPMGEGGMGTVYEGVHLRLRRKLAIKLLHPRFARDPKARRRFEGEARAAAELIHPGIVKVLDFGEAEADTYFLVMELLEGHDLDVEMRRGQMPVSRAVGIAREVCSALEAIHAKGIVHRDLKPANIFLVRDGKTERVKVLDFGIAKFMHPWGDLETAHTATGQTIGTPVYMSPEQARGLRDVDHRTDLYALGVILFEALTGTSLFDATNTPDLLLQICHGTVPRLRERRPDLPQALDDVVQRLIERAAADRFASAAEVGAALEPFAAQGLGESPVLYPVGSSSEKAAFGETLLDPRGPSPPEDALPAVPATPLPSPETTVPAPPSIALPWTAALGAVLVLGLVSGAALWATSEPPAAPTTTTTSEATDEPPIEPPLEASPGSHARRRVDPRQGEPEVDSPPLQPVAVDLPIGEPIPEPVDAVEARPTPPRHRANQQDALADPTPDDATPESPPPEPPVAPAEPPTEAPPAEAPPARDIFRLPVP